MKNSEPTSLEATLRQDRAILIGGLLAVIAVAWIWLLLGAGTGMDALDMTRQSNPVGLSPGSDMVGAEIPDADVSASASAPAAAALLPATMARTPEWSAGYALLMAGMWWVMMVAMMLPSAAPLLLLFARVNRKERARGRPIVATGIFATGYVVVWGLFSFAATGLQWALDTAGLLSSMLVSTSAMLGGGLLIAAGAWQLSPIKQACLRHCRSPIGFLSAHWHKGRAGALRMGLHHGLFCLGCCWFLMGLLFYGGVMNLYWIIGLAAFVLLEKFTPAGHWFGKAMGGALLAWGGLVVVGNW